MTRFAFLHRACKTQLAIMAQMKCAMHFGLHSCFCKHWTSLQRWPVCSQIPKSISIISVCSHLSLCYVLSNIKCGQGKYCLVFMLVFIVVALGFGFRKPHNGTYEWITCTTKCAQLFIYQSDWYIYLWSRPIT